MPLCSTENGHNFTVTEDGDTVCKYCGLTISKEALVDNDEQLRIKGT